MAPMATEWIPEDDTAKTFNRYRQALKTERELKQPVKQLAVEALRTGATVAKLAELTGMTPEVFRRLAREHAIPVDARYQGRAEQFRARAADSSPPADA